MTRKPRPIRPAPVTPGTYKRLPEPVRVEDTITSAETQPVPEEKDEYWREVEWMLRITGGV